MSNNRDNWERLVGAVLRRMHDLELAYCPSPTTTSSSASADYDLSYVSSSLSQFQLDASSKVQTHGTTWLPMDYSDLTLDHYTWKSMLRPGQNELLYRSASMRFFLEHETGENCFMLGTSRLEFKLGNWKMKSNPKSRFGEVAELMRSHEFEIRSCIDTQTLTPNTLYAAYLVFTLDGSLDGLPVYANCTLKTSSGGSEDARREILLFRRSGYRGNGWLGKELGDFYVPNKGKKSGILEVVLKYLPIQCFDLNQMESGLITVEGIEFRPSTRINGRGIGVRVNLVHAFPEGRVASWQ